MAAPRNGCGAKTMERKMTKKSPRSATSEPIVAAKPKSSAPRGRQRTKKQIALSLLKRSKGTTVAEMQKAMGWQAHSVRGFLAATVKKMSGVILTSEKTVGRPRRYHIEAAGE